MMFFLGFGAGVFWAMLLMWLYGKDSDGELS